MKPTIMARNGMIGNTVWIVLLLTVELNMNVETTKVEVKVHQNVPAKRLVCWTCNHGNGLMNTNCVTMTNKTAIEQRECNLHEYFCKVRRITDERGVQLMERACANRCNTGCQQINKLQSCEDCCTQPLCNVGNNAPSHVLPLSLISSWIPYVFMMYTVNIVKL